MKVVTPEIAWHETLPIYSCDFQPILNHAITKQRDPLTELPVIDSAPTDRVAENTKKIDIQNCASTRLATAGGDNMVRLWRVQLDWTPPSSVTVDAPINPTSKGLLQSEKSVNTKKTGCTPKVSAAVSDGLTFLSTLKRHTRLVNVVRWSPSGQYLASAGDDQFVIIWCLQPSTHSSNAARIPPIGVEEVEEQNFSEIWLPCRSLRRHLEDIYDLCWSPDETSLLSGSVDHSAILWQLDLAPTDTDRIDQSQAPAQLSGTVKTIVLRDHKHYVQGVAWDPLGNFIATMSSDRTCRIYRVASKTVHANISKVGKHHLFQDDSWKSFFRRPSFSPDGLLLLCPAGNIETAPFAGDMAAAVASVPCSSLTDKPQLKTQSEPSSNPAACINLNVAPQHTAHFFLRNNFNKPCLSLPTGPRPVVAVRFCNQPFQLRLSNPKPGIASSSLFDLPYRWLFCLVLEDGLLFYDTQQAHPFAQVSHIHYQALNDVAWSNDGRLIVASSTDGYCSFIYFTVDELGKPYHGTTGLTSQISAIIPDPLTVQPDDVASIKVPIQECSRLEDSQQKSVISTAIAKPDEMLHEKHQKRITFQNYSTPTAPHHSLPVTPGTGRYLSNPLVTPSPMVKAENKCVIQEQSNEKRRVPFVTISTECDSDGKSNIENSQ